MAKPMGIYERIRLGLVKVKATRSPALHRFLSRVNKNGPLHPVLGRCWSWEGYTGKRGYGRLTVESKIVRAHRFSYEHYVAPIPRGLGVMHKCDNPSCVNPDHLDVGTCADNQFDKVSKGRQAKGKDNAGTSLTEQAVAEIRRRYVRGCRENGQIALAREFGVVRSNIYSIIRGETWRHLLIEAELATSRPPKRRRFLKTKRSKES